MADYSNIVVQKGYVPSKVQVDDNFSYWKEDKKQFVSTAVKEWFNQVGGSQALFFDQVSSLNPDISFDVYSAIASTNLRFSKPWACLVREKNSINFLVGQHNYGLSNCALVSGDFTSYKKAWKKKVLNINGQEMLVDFTEAETQHVMLSSTDVVLKFGDQFLKVTPSIGEAKYCPSIGRLSNGKKIYDVFEPNESFFALLDRKNRMYVSLYRIKADKLSANHAVFSSFPQQEGYQRDIKAEAVVAQETTQEGFNEWKDNIYQIMKEAVFSPLKQYNSLLNPLDKKKEKKLTRLAILGLFMLTGIIAFEAVSGVFGWSVSLGATQLPLWGLGIIVLVASYGWYLKYSYDQYQKAKRSLYAPIFYPLNGGDELGSGLLKDDGQPVMTATGDRNPNEQCAQHIFL